MYSNPECSNFLSKFYPNPEEVSDENRIALYLLDGICQYKESHHQISNVFDIYVAAIRRARLSFIEQIPIMDYPRDDNGNIIYPEEEGGGGKKMNKKESTDTLKSQKSKNASKKSLKDDLKSNNNEEEFESAASLGIPKEIFNFNILLEWSYWTLNTTCSTLCTVLPNELIDDVKNNQDEESKENETKESEKEGKKEKKGKVEEEVVESENDKLKKIVFRLLREIDRLMEYINSKHCNALFHRVLDGLIELFKPRKWVREVAKDVRMLKVLLRKLKDEDFEIRNKIEVLLTLLCKYEKEEVCIDNNNNNEITTGEGEEMKEDYEEEMKVNEEEEESKINDDNTLMELRDNNQQEEIQQEEGEEEKIKIHTIEKPSIDEEIQNILKPKSEDTLPYLNVNLLRSLLESENTDLDMKCRICRFIYLIIKNEDNANIIISADLIPVLLQVLLPVYPIEDEEENSEEMKIESPTNQQQECKEGVEEEKKDNEEESKINENEECKVNEEEEGKEMEQSESNVEIENKLEPLTPLHYNIYISIIKTVYYYYYY